MAEAATIQEEYYISITGLSLKGPFYKKPFQFMMFMRYAIPSLNQAKAAEGNVTADTRTINGVHHTLSVWQSRRYMAKFMYSGNHREAISAFRKFFVGKTYGYASKTVPSWEEVLKIYQQKAKEY